MRTIRRASGRDMSVKAKLVNAVIHRLGTRLILCLCSPSGCFLKSTIRSPANSLFSHKEDTSICHPQPLHRVPCISFADALRLILSLVLAERLISWEWTLLVDVVSPTVRGTKGVHCSYFSFHKTITLPMSVSRTWLSGKTLRFLPVLDDLARCSDQMAKTPRSRRSHAGSGWPTTRLQTRPTSAHGTEILAVET
jgi:hypothetical protein